MRKYPRGMLADSVLGHFQIVVRLKIDPVTVRGAEICRQQYGHFGRNRPLLTHDVVHPRERHIKRLGQCVGRKPDWLHKLLTKNSAWMSELELSCRHS